MSISAIILTYNESLHIRRCIESLLPVVDHIYVMDSYSTDTTLKILAEYPSVTVSDNKFINYSSQFNHALDFFKINSDWVIRIDADEYLDDELAHFLKKTTPTLDDNIKGIYFNRYMTFMGKLLRHGGMSSYWMLRMWRNGYGRCESTWMDEHIILQDGDTINAKGKLIDDNLNTLSWWSHKHVDYSTREAIDILQKEMKTVNSSALKGNIFGSTPEKIRFLKNIYNNIPLFIRPFIYFIYRYFFTLGFLDGKQGFLWCLFQGFWYRMLVDAKVYELKRSASKARGSVKDTVKKMYGYDI